MTKDNLGREGFMCLTYPGPQSTEGSQERHSKQKPRAETEAETIQEHCLPACSLWFAQHTFLYTPGLPTWGCHSPQWPINHSSRKFPTDLPTGHLMEAFSQSRVLFPDNSSLCQINKKLTRTRCLGEHSGLEQCWRRRKAVSKQVYLVVC